MTLLVWRSIGLLIALVTAVWGTTIVWDFHTDFRRFVDVVARREARREARAKGAT